MSAEQARHPLGQGEGSAPPEHAARPGEHPTLGLGRGRAPAPTVRRFRLTVLEGPGAGRGWESAGDTCALGSHPSNDFVLEDPTVSRFHCEVRMGADGVRVRDLGSRNGTIVDGVVVVEAFLRSGSVLRLGHTALRFDLGAETNHLLLSERSRFGALSGTSVAMRACFALMERAAASDATVLLEGETGTGKTQAAQAIHEAGARRERPFLVVDCGAIPGALLESELFGHERGAFTGALARRLGAFEEADGGTVLLDEVGELPAELQPKLLRVLENRVIRRVGTNAHVPVDVRVIAATHRDLREEVNAGRFRADLFFRLAVVRIPLPPLRQRPEDLPALVEHILASFRVSPEQAAPLRAPEFLHQLQRGAWPGNVRELRNHLERCLVLQAPMPLGEASAPAGSLVPDARVPYPEARRRMLEAFERAYLDELLRLHEGKVSQAAAAADMDRVYLYRLLRRHGLKP